MAAAFGVMTLLTGQSMYDEAQRATASTVGAALLGVGAGAFMLWLVTAAIVHAIRESAATRLDASVAAPIQE